MRFLVSVNHDGAESTLGPFDLATAEATVARLASELVTREPFRAYVVPVPDTYQSQQAPAGLDANETGLRLESN